MFLPGRKLLLAAAGVLAAFIAGCTSPSSPAVPPPARFAHITGSEESSLLLDNFTAFIAAVDGQPVAAGRKGWVVPLEIKAGHRKLTVEFVRGVFTAQTEVELDAAPDAAYQLKYATDAQLFGHNSYCDFWIIDLATGKTVGAVKKAPVTKAP